MRITQEQLVLRHLEDFGSITTWEAIQEYGITRLSAMIHLLRKQGHNIESENVTTKNRYGNSTTFSKYYIT